MCNLRLALLSEAALAAAVAALAAPPSPSTSMASMGTSCSIFSMLGSSLGMLSSCHSLVWGRRRHQLACSSIT